MIQMMNNEFFIMKRKAVFSKKYSLYYTLLNIDAHPKKFDLPVYKKTPFMSIILRDERNLSDTTMYDDDFIYDIINKKEFIQYSMYTGTTYDELRTMYGDDTICHSLIFVNADEMRTSPICCATNDADIDLASSTKKNAHPLFYDSPSNILIAAIPCNGIIDSIPRSKHYKLYNASLVVLSTAPFKYKGRFYDKLLYILTDITSYFSFDESVFTNSATMRRLNHHYFGIGYPDAMGTTLPALEIKSKIISSIIDCDNRPDREHIFDRGGKNMFHLSDIPDIAYKNNILSR